MPKLSIDVEARYASWGQAVEQIRRDGERVANQIESAFGSINKLFAAAGVGSAIGGFVALIKSAANELDGLAKSAQAVGVTVESLSALRYAASFAGVEAQQLDRGLVQLSDRIQKVAQGNKEAVAVFDAMKISIRDTAGAIKPTDVILAEIADRFASYRDGAEKTAIAADLFGQKIGPQLIPLLNAGSSGLQDLREEAERLGLVIGTDAAKNAERFNDELARMAKQLEAIKLAFAGPLIENIANLAELFNKLRANKAGIGDTFGLIDQLIGGGPLARGKSPSDVLRDYEQELDKLVAKRKQLAEAEIPTVRGALAPQFQAEAKKRRADELAALDDQIARTQTLRDKLAEVYKLYPDYAAQMSQSQGKGSAPVPRVAGSERVTEAQKLVDSLNRQVEAAAELTAYEQTLLAIDRAKEPFTQGERDRALSLAQRVDALKAEKEARKESEELNRIIAQAESRYLQQLDAEIAKYKELADPVDKYVKQLERVEELRAAGALTQQQAQANIARIWDEIYALDKTKDKLEETGDIAKKLGLTFESAFEKAAFEASSLLDVIRALAIDMAKLFLRQQVTKPLFEWAAGLFNPQPNITQDQLRGFTNPELFNLVPQSGATLSQTINVAAGVSMAAVSSAVAQGVQIGQAAILDSRARGGAFA